MTDEILGTFNWARTENLSVQFVENMEWVTAAFVPGGISHGAIRLVTSLPTKSNDYGEHVAIVTSGKLHDT